MEEKKAKKKKIGLTGIALIMLLVYMLTEACFYVVPMNQYAVVREFGRIVAVENEPGIHMKKPFISVVSEISKALQVYDIAPSGVITRDKKSMIADNFVIWRVTDPTRFIQSLSGSQDAAEDRVGVAVYNATKNLISSMTQDEILLARNNGAEGNLSALITKESNSDISAYGIEILEAEIKALDLPDDNKEAVYTRMISERENIAAGYKAQGEAEAQKIRNDTDRQIKIRLAEARARAEMLKAEGEAAYMQKLQEAYNTEEKADFYNFTIQLDALKRSLSGDSKTLILDKDSELASIFYGIN